MTHDPPGAQTVQRSRDERGTAHDRKYALDAAPGAHRSDFGFYDNRGRFVVEAGTIDVFAGDSSTADLQQSFTVGF
jgi:beta-glucosidase